MDNIKQVLLAPNEIPSPDEHRDANRFPFMVSTKLDGMRCFIRHGELLTRSMKHQANVRLGEHLRHLIEWTRVTGSAIDGELYSKDLGFNELSGILRSHSQRIPDHIQFYAFDVLQPMQGIIMDTPFNFRDTFLQDEYDRLRWPNVRPLFHRIVTTRKELVDTYDSVLDLGMEGLMLRNPHGRYKSGRATIKENILYKMKPFDELDAVISGFNEQQSIRPDAKRFYNEMGNLARTSRAENLFDADTMGSLKVRDEKGREFAIGWGPGWTHERRKTLWDMRLELIGRWVKLRYFPYGEKDLPRMPQLLALRDSK